MQVRPSLIVAILVVVAGGACRREKEAVSPIWVPLAPGVEIPAPAGTVPFRVRINVMRPTFDVDDLVFLGTPPTAPRRGDVVLFPFPREPHDDWFGRVIGVSGDTVQIRDGDAVLNGKELPHDPIPGITDYEDRHLQRFDEVLDGKKHQIVHEVQPNGARSMHVTFDAVRVPDGSVYVLPDQRDHLYWGLIAVKDLKGLVVDGREAKPTH